MEASIKLHQEGGLATLTLDNPGKLNAINLSMWRELHRVMDQVSRDESVRCVILRGAGDHFAAGGDLEEFQTLRTTLDQALVYHEEVANALEAIHHCDHPTVAMIRGACIGGGLEIAAQCDIRICDSTARFGAPINKLGFSMYPGEMAGLLKLAGPALVAEILLEARILDAEDAARKNLVSRVVAPEKLEEEIAACVRRIMGGAPRVATWHKQWMRRLSHDLPLTDAEKAASFAFLETEDYREGLAAFLEKRPPRFTGK
ncbi:enoyl-CoA hydratase/isomerase family protein [Azovibrio restrictus]|uniref:enoyl-CoA hydratase/isomerase family protein n=1 Tax=Azovibrio restrictus TaxID=146938 RepID=UPI00041B376A|nr:enoyl-CoA hydratase-related protein [Azovibrio restrictus]